MFSPKDKNIFITDTYPDKRRNQHLLLIDLKNEKINLIDSFYSPQNFTGQVRCDLHPRWDIQGKSICIDTPLNKKRNMVVIKFDE